MDLSSQDKNNQYSEQVQNQNYSPDNQVSNDGILNNNKFSVDSGKKPNVTVIILAVLVLVLLSVLNISRFLNQNQTSEIDEQQKYQEILTTPIPVQTNTPKVSISVRETGLPTPTRVVPRNTATPIPTQKAAPTSTPTPYPTPADTTPPTFDQFGGPADGGTYNYNNFCFPMHLTDNAPGELQVKYKFDQESWSDWGSNFSPCYNNVSNGPHQFQAQGRDANGNETAVVTRSFIIQH
jgi:hypothetical protein